MALNSGLWVAIVAVLGATVVVADLPVHCLHKHVRGTWTFHLGEANQDKHQIMCSQDAQGKPRTRAFGDEDNNYGLGDPAFPVKKQIKVVLDHPNIATTTLVDAQGNSQEHKGTWTMIYDEGFEVNIADTKFFAFSKYTGDKDNEYSHCGQTFPGWFHPAKSIDTQKWGCYYGVKDTKVEPQKFRKFGKRPVSSDDVFVREDELVEFVNHHPKASWKAGHYTKFEGRPMAELQRSMGTVLRPYKLQPADRTEQQHWARDVLIDVSDVPEQWDWRNVDGENFMGDVYDQGNCGSCYAVAVSEMVSSRMRILSKNKASSTTRRTSPNMVLKCSFYAQGCDGGFPYLASKHLQDFGSVSADTEPYEDSDEGGCPAVSRAQIVSRNVGYKYVGGYYGACGEKAMMRELFDHGPFVVGFEVGLGFQQYQEGVFSALSKLPEKNHWERVNHAVLISGFGTDNGVPYWLVKNSWGPDWGERGYFRIKRGDDNLNIEHMAVAAYPSIGNAMPPSSGQIFMAEGTSLGQAYLSLMKVDGNLKTSTVNKEPHHDSSADVHIYDPAFTRNSADDDQGPYEEEDSISGWTGDIAAPAMEEVQTAAASSMADKLSSASVDAVVDERDGADWPEA